MAITDTQYTADDDTQKLTVREEAHVKELERLAEHLEEANLLYGSALDGMKPGIDESARKLDEAGLNEKMTAAEDELAQKASDMLAGDVGTAEEAEADLDTDDAEEDALLAEDEEAPEETIG